MAKPDIQQIKQRFGIIGTAPGLNRAIDIALQVASTDLSVLITGESGVGKEFFPQIIHQFSYRKHGPYIAVNCGAIPEGTIDSELFGHEKGSFTGALNDRKGYFEVADGGTIFLDEVGELPLSTQARLLRVLETGEFIKVGSSKVLKTNVRIVAATNMVMNEAVSTGRFREDLYYRLNTVPIHVPALRERGSDAALLFRKFASDFAEKYRMPAMQLSDDAKSLLVSYRWPGNIRQLKNITEQISIIEEAREVTADMLKMYLPADSSEHLPAFMGRQGDGGKVFGSEREILYQVLFDMRKDVNDLKALVNGLMNGGTVESAEVSPVSSFEDLRSVPVVQKYPSLHQNTPMKNDLKEAAEYVEETLSLEEVEKEMIKKALDRHHGKRNKAASDLKISERTLYRKIKEYGLE
ncbi:MAG: sigma-54 dependent transcriptional regulator [Bacteroidales bacterium]|nr:sigma-54 dependent transcriptional regulator [Bacteroidales bacterium]